MDPRMSSYYLEIILLLFTSVCGQDFGYTGDLGPSHWGEKHPMCKGKYQSPININSLNVVRTHLPPLMLQGFKNSPGVITLANNGHTLMITINADKSPTIAGGPLSGPYVFTQLHFHWGENDNEGSEDLLDGRSFPMEMHMVFYKKPYRDVRDAMDHDDGLTVLAFFYVLSEEPNPKYEALLSHIQEIAQPGTNTTVVESESFADLISHELTSYYTYKGSLTTPPCSERVIWIDFENPIPLSHDQLETVRSLYDTHGHLLTHNFRPIQPLGDRIVYYVSKKQQSEFEFISSSARPQSDYEYNTTDTIETTERKVIDQDDNSLGDGQSVTSTETPTTTTTRHSWRKWRKNHGANLKASMFVVLFVCGLCSIYLSTSS